MPDLLEQLDNASVLWDARLVGYAFRRKEPLSLVFWQCLRSRDRVKNGREREKGFVSYAEGIEAIRLETEYSIGNIEKQLRKMVGPWIIITGRKENKKISYIGSRRIIRYIKTLPHGDPLRNLLGKTKASEYEQPLNKFLPNLRKLPSHDKLTYIKAELSKLVRITGTDYDYNKSYGHKGIARVLGCSLSTEERLCRKSSKWDQQTIQRQQEADLITKDGELIILADCDKSKQRTDEQVKELNYKKQLNNYPGGKSPIVITTGIGTYHKAKQQVTNLYYSKSGIRERIKRKIPTDKNKGNKITGSCLVRSSVHFQCYCPSIVPPYKKYKVGFVEELKTTVWHGDQLNVKPLVKAKWVE